MSKLLSANFSRLFKSKALWICMAAMLGIAIYYMIFSNTNVILGITQVPDGIDRYFFIFGVFIGIFVGAFCSFFTGVEYSDGTLRNKIVVGHTRANIYLANLITNVTGSLLIMMMWVAGAMVGIPVLGLWDMGVLGLVTYLFIAILFVVTFCAIFTFVSMLTPNMAVSLIISIGLFLLLFFIVSSIYNRLSESEFLSGMVISNGATVFEEGGPNPSYVKGEMRSALEFALDLLPQGQGMLMTFIEIANPLRMALCSIGITIVTTLGGILLFNRKNLK